LVCVVDDDASLRRSLGNLLTSVGVRVLDVRTCGISGVELLTYLAAAGSRIP
jgi:FixJ family two-component response regulator